MTSRHGSPPGVGVDFVDGDAIAILTLDDPARGNAMSPEMGDAFRDLVHRLAGRHTLRVVVVRGAGSTFSIGAPRDMLIGLGDESMSYEQRRDFMLGFYDRWLALLELPVPVIAAIEGDCIGVAPMFACASDICVADERANFQITFASLDLYPGMAMSYLVPRSTGPQRAALWVYGGQPFSGAEAAEAGLAARSVPAGTVHAESLALARQIAASGPATIRAVKNTLRIRREDLEPVLQSDARQQAESYAGAEFRQRIRRYLTEPHDESAGPGGENPS